MPFPPCSFFTWNAKVNKMFGQMLATCCSVTDMSYVAVCEGSRHIYIYRQPVAIATELRNRRTGQHVTRVAKQQLVNLDSVSQVLGVHASCHMLYVLTVDTLFALRVSYNPSPES